MSLEGGARGLAAKSRPLSSCLYGDREHDCALGALSISQGWRHPTGTKHRRSQAGAEAKQGQLQKAIAKKPTLANHMK